MKKIRLSKQDALLYYRMNLLSDIRSLLKVLETFRQKYQMDFPAFEKKLQRQKKENFQEWDDYLEWKSYWQSYQEKIKEMQELESETDIELVAE